MILTSVFEFFQACTEMVMPMCSDGINDFFEPTKWDLKTYSDECFRQWKVKPDPYAAILKPKKRIEPHLGKFNFS